MKGRLSNAELMEILFLSHMIFLCLSESEGVPVYNGSLSFGIPVIATNVGGVSEIVTDELTDSFLPDVSAELVAQTIEKYYSLSINEKNKLRKNAYTTWNDKFNSERIITTL